MDQSKINTNWLKMCFNIIWPTYKPCGLTKTRQICLALAGQGLVNLTKSWSNSILIKIIKFLAEFFLKMLTFDFDISCIDHSNSLACLTNLIIWYYGRLYHNKLSTTILRSLVNDRQNSIMRYVNKRCMLTKYRHVRFWVSKHEYHLYSFWTL